MEISQAFDWHFGSNKVLTANSLEQFELPCRKPNIAAISLCNIGIGIQENLRT